KVFFQGNQLSPTEDYEKNCKKLIENFKNIIWMTYRRNFFPLLHNTKDHKIQNYISDTGWGCMVRVGQMALAEGLRHHLQQKGIYDNKRIIQAFLDNDFGDDNIAPYSIQKICKIAYKEFQLVPGQWYSPVRICHVLSLLHNDKKQILDCEDLKVGVFSTDRPIIIADMIKKINPGVQNACEETNCQFIKNQKDQKIVCQQHNQSIFSLL
ncbi:peptidase family c54 protein, putative, partial [Ichthyophthirius multifiliis]